MSYASRFQRQDRTRSPASSKTTTSSQSSFLPTAGSVSKTPPARGAWSSPTLKRVVAPKSNSVLSGRNPPLRGGAGSSASIFYNTNMASPNGGDGALVTAVSQKLKGFQELRELMEALAERHKKEEGELQTLMKRILAGSSQRPHSSRGGGAAIGPVAALVASPEMTTALQTAVEERDRAIAMLQVFREEGNQVMHRMHQSLSQAHDQHEELMNKVNRLSLENNRLRYIVREVREDITAEIDHDDDFDDEEDANKGAETHEETKRRLHISIATIAKLDDLLQEADAVITNLRSHNEELLKQSERLRQRERERRPSVSFGDSHSEPASESSVMNHDAPGKAGTVGEEDAPHTTIAHLKLQLRVEKSQRLEAEELSHKLLIEHQKNVHLLEQRLTQNRNSTTNNNIGNTPRGATPRRVASSLSGPNGNNGQQQTTSHAAAAASTVVAAPHPLEEEMDLMLNTPTSDANIGDDDMLVPAQHRHQTVGSTQSNDQRDTSKKEMDASSPFSQNADDDDEHQRNIDELRNIEEQLKEVVASLEDA